MDLILEIVSPNGQSLGRARRKVFGPEGGRIGRSPECEWVLTNPYISRHHATIRWISGTYYIESAGENGVAINTAQAMIPQRERRALRNGDRLFLDEYEITVGIGAVDESAVSPVAGRMAFASSDDLLGDLAATARSPILSISLEPSPDELDPLKQLSGGSPGRAAFAARPEANWNHTPGVLDQFTPPAISPTSPPTSSGVIPDDWDGPNLGRADGTAPGAAKSVAPASDGSRSNSAVSDPLAPADGSDAVGGGFAPIPDDWNDVPDDLDKMSFSRPAAPGTPVLPAPGGGSGRAGAQPVSRPRETPLPVRPVPVSPAPRASVQQTPLNQQTPLAPVGFTQQMPAPPGPTPPVSTQHNPVANPAESAGGNLDLTAFLRAAGVDPATIPSETATSLGLILRTVVQGVVEVLRARAEIKDQFRLPHTRIKTTENNPLKFAVDAEDALNALLGRRNAAYLPPVEAFEDAFDDIRFHQMAMLAGMRAGFEHALKRFDPERLQEVFNKRVKRGGLLQLSTKSRYWELYAEEFHELTADPDDAFKRLFGEVFAGAYEQQLEELKRGRRKPR